MARMYFLILFALNSATVCADVRSVAAYCNVAAPGGVDFATPRRPWCRLAPFAGCGVRHGACVVFFPHRYQGDPGLTLPASGVCRFGGRLSGKQVALCHACS